MQRFSLYKLLLVVVIPSLLHLTCSGPSSSVPTANKAKKFLEDNILIDTHIDAPYKLKKEWRDLTQKVPERNFDYPRANKGGLDAAFMSIWINPKYQKTGTAKEEADTLIDLVEKMVRQHDKFIKVTAPEQIREFAPSDTVLLPLGIENGAAIEGQLDNLQHFYQRGVRYITLCHSKWNDISDSSYDDDRKWKGLSSFGRKVVQRMNQLGIMVDVSHITDSAFYDVMEVTQAPVIASHSSCRHFTPGWERNMSDTLIKRLAQNNGVIQITFGSAFVKTDYNKNYRQYKKKTTQYKKQHNLSRGDTALQKFKDKIKNKYSFEKATVNDVADHIDHVVDLVGVEHVGLGSDFDGVGPTLPIGLEGVGQYPNLIQELFKRGYTKSELKKICGGNLLRVWEKVEEVADTLSVQPINTSVDTGATI